MALDRAYINYAKFEELTDRGVVYVTKVKKNLSYEILVDCMYQNSQGHMEYREQVVVFRKCQGGAGGVVGHRSEGGGQAQHRADRDIQIAVGIDECHTGGAGRHDHGLTQYPFQHAGAKEPAAGPDAENNDNCGQHDEGKDRQEMPVAPDDLDALLPREVQRGILFRRSCCRMAHHRPSLKSYTQ